MNVFLKKTFWIYFGFTWLCASMQDGFAFSAYSNAELDQLEKQFIQQINLSNSVIREPLANQYINHLAKLLSIHGDVAQPYFFIVRSNEINAFAGPGGYIGVNSQLILASDTESELAAVMAHEMAHVRQHHLYRMIEHQKQMRIPMLASMLASIALGVVNPALGSGALMGSLSGFSQDSINYVRSNEKEADRIGIDMLSHAGFDAQGMANFFKKMQESARYTYTANMPEILRTHPLDENRIAEAEERCLSAPKHADPNHLDYQLFKSLVRSLAATDQRRLLTDYQYTCNHTPHREACQYGYALALMRHNDYEQAREKLSPLIQADKNNLFYAIAMADIEENTNQYASAIKRLTELQSNFPDNYAILMALAKAHLAANQADKAAAILLKGRRQFKSDVGICLQLARAQAANHRKDYAYFTLAECHLLQGEEREAVRKLKVAKTLVTHDEMLRERISAKLDEIILDPK